MELKKILKLALEIEKNIYYGVVNDEGIAYVTIEDIKHDIITSHSTSKGHTVHYLDVDEEYIAYYDKDDNVKILVNNEVKAFCYEEKIY